ncbi:MAG: phosphopantothenoylcysteine decarboxylase [Lentisphaerae bacterium]|nr:phosphopantothenoylcysteine decarboxylase [Lentisphaerota bacterium]
MACSVEILLGVTGSIAAYKAAELVRLMTAREWGVSVVMTPAAERFVGELTFRTLTRRPVARDMFAPEAGAKPVHIALAQRADIYLIAPCSADILAKLAHGLADDVLCCTALAFKGPLLLAPSMNEAMWDHPAVRANLDVLTGRGVTIVSVGQGDLACGDTGRGRMAEPRTILDAVDALLPADR